MPTTAVDTYALTPEQVDFRDTIRQIVRERVAPRAAEIDAKAEYPWDLRSCSPSRTCSACRSTKSTAAPAPAR